MPCFSCGISSGFKSLSRAAAKAAGEKLRRMRVLRVSQDWVRRAEICERCPMRVIHKGVSYCGSPLLRKVVREPTIDGCGCPTIAKARDPSEHCPITRAFQAPTRRGEQCDCKWCEGTGLPGPAQDVPSDLNQS